MLSLHPPAYLPVACLPPQVSGYGRQSWLREGGAFPRVDAANIEEALNKSLARLGTDHVDLLQVCVSVWWCQWGAGWEMLHE